MKTLADIVNDFCELKGWTQTEFARRVGLNRSIVSRIASGHTQNPDKPTMQKLAEVMEMDVRDLQLACVDSQESRRETFDIGFVPSMAAAPLALLALDDRYRDIMQFSCHGEAHGPTMIPHFSGAAKEDRGNQEHMRLFSPSCLVDLLDKGKIDVAVMPSGVLSEDNPFYSRLARFAVQPYLAGARLIARRDIEGTTPHDFSSLAPDIPFLCADDAQTQKFAEQLWEEHHQEGQAMRPMVSIMVDDLSQSRKSIMAALQKPPHAVVVVAWEPFLTWFTPQGDQYDVKSWEMPEEVSSKNYSELMIFCRSERAQDIMRSQQFQRFLGVLYTAIEKIETARESLPRYSFTLQEVQEYFANLATQTAENGHDTEWQAWDHEKAARRGQPEIGGTAYRLLMTQEALRAGRAIA